MLQKPHSGLYDIVMTNIIFVAASANNLNAGCHILEVDNLGNMNNEIIKRIIH